MRQNEVRATEHNNTPAGRQGNQAVTKATRYPEGGTSEKTGPGRHKGPTAGGREASIGREGSQQQPNKRQKKGGPTTHKKGHDDHGQSPIAAQAETPTQRKHNQRGATHERKQNTRPRTTDGRESTAQGKTAPNQPTRQNKKGATRGQNPTEARKRIPTTPQQVGANRNVAPKERGHRR